MPPKSASKGNGHLALLRGHGHRVDKNFERVYIKSI